MNHIHHPQSPKLPLRGNNKAHSDIFLLLRALLFLLKGGNGTVVLLKFL